MYTETAHKDKFEIIQEAIKRFGIKNQYAPDTTAIICKKANTGENEGYIVVETGSLAQCVDKLLEYNEQLDNPNIITLAPMVSLKKVDKEEEEFDIFSDCPDCGQHTVKGKGWDKGGGEECTNPDCDYWFCY